MIDANCGSILNSLYATFTPSAGFRLPAAIQSHTISTTSNRSIPATSSRSPSSLPTGRGRTKTGYLWCYAVDDRPWCCPLPSSRGLHLCRGPQTPATHTGPVRVCRDCSQACTSGHFNRPRALVARCAEAVFPRHRLTRPRSRTQAAQNGRLSGR